MRSLFLCLVITLVSLSFIGSVHAKRFGGGKSFGTQRSATNFARSQTQPMTNRLKSATSPSRWLGPLAGLAAGGLLAYLFMGHGVGSGILSWLAIAAVLFMIIRLFQSRRPLATAHPGQYGSMQQEPSQSLFSNQQNMHTHESYQSYSPPQSLIPANFDTFGMLRDAKVQFIRLQSAYDQKNTHDIRSFTTPEVFAEILMQLQERGEASNYTEVVQLDAELLEAEEKLSYTTATVKFTGRIKEGLNAEAQPFTEIWHFSKDTEKTQWLVAGIEQV